MGQIGERWEVFAPWLEKVLSRLPMLPPLYFGPYTVVLLKIEKSLYSREVFLYLHVLLSEAK